MSPHAGEPPRSGLVFSICSHKQYTEVNVACPLWNPPLLCFVDLIDYVVVSLFLPPAPSSLPELHGCILFDLKNRCGNLTRKVTKENKGILWNKQQAQVSGCRP